MIFIDIPTPWSLPTDNMATGGGDVNDQLDKILGIEDLSGVISTLKRSYFPAGRWSDLGLELHIDHPKLDAIKADNPQACLTDCLVLWLQQDYDVDKYGKPTLEKLAFAIKEMGLKAVAEKIGKIKVIEPEGWSGLRRRNDKKATILATYTIESDVHKEFRQLESTFATLVAKIRAHLAEKVKHQKLETIDVARFVEEKRKLTGLTDEVSIDKLFNRIQDHYSYLNCSLIEAIVYECFEKSSCMEYITHWLPFVPHSGTAFLQREMKAYVEKMSHFKDSKRLKDLQFAIGNAYQQNFVLSDTACKVFIKLNGGWDEKTISDLEFLLKHYFNQSDIFNHIQITPGSVCITYLVPRSAIVHITNAVKSKSESMHRVGVFYFSINGVILLEKKNNVNFNESLITAVKLSDTFEVSLLLSLGADPYYEDDNGDKVLDLALQGGNEEIIELIAVATDTQVMELESQEELTDEETVNNGEKEKLKVEIQRLQDSNAELERSLAASKRENDELLLQKKENETELQTLKNQLKKCYLEIDDLKVKCKEDLNIISSLEADVSDEKKTMSKQETEIAALQEALSLASLQKEENEAELKKLTASNMYLESEKLDLDRLLAKSKDESQVLQDKILSLEADVLSLRNEVIVKEKMLFEQTEQTKSGTEEIAILQDKISSLSVQLLKQPSCIGLCEDKATQSEAITTMDQSVQSMEILLPEIDRDELKIEGMLTPDDLIDVLDLLKRCGFPETRWHELGLRLRLGKSTLDVIEVKHRGDVSRCMTECLSQWLRRADNVDSRGGATFDSLSDALRFMNETAVAEKLNQEKLLPALAVSLYNSYSPLLSESLSDPVSVARLLNAEHVITGQVLASVESASPSVPNQREVLLAAIREAIQNEYSFLQTFASVLCKFTDNVQLGKSLLRDYGKHFSNNVEFVNAIIEEDTSSTGGTIIPSSPHFPTAPTVEIPVRKSKSREFSSIRASHARMIFKVSKAITQKSPPLEDLKSLICQFNSDLEAKLAECNDISSVLYVIEGECSLTDVELLETVVEEFEVTEAERYIEQYKTTLEESCHSLSIDLCLKEKFDAVNISPSLKCETATYVFDWRPDEKKLKDITDILSKTSGKFVKIKYIDAGY